MWPGAPRADCSAMAVEAIARSALAWSLAELADRPAFDRYLDAIATAIADRFTVRVHVNVAGRRHAYNDWIATLQDGKASVADHRRFIRMCADLIATLASRRIVGYSAMIRDASDPMGEVVLRYPNEITALAAGASLYITRVTALTGIDPSEPLEPSIAENAAAHLRRHPKEAAERFRELLQLSTPWM